MNNLKEAIVEKMIDYGKKNRRLKVPVIMLITLFLVLFHGTRNFFIQFRLHPFRQRLLAGALCVCLVISSMPATDYAFPVLAAQDPRGAQEDGSENVNDDIYPNVKREIVSFTELPDEIKEQAVEVGTPVAGLELPDTLTALCRIPNEENPDSGADPDKEQDSDKDDKQPDKGEKERPEEDPDGENGNGSDDSDQESGSESEDSDNENGDDSGNSGNEGAEKPEDTDKDNGETTEGSTDEENGEAAEEGTHEGNGETSGDSAGNADDAEGESGGGNAESTGGNSDNESTGASEGNTIEENTVSTVEAIKEGIRAAADNNKAIEIQKTVTVKMRENYAMPHVVSEIKELSYEAASAVSDIESEESSSGLGEASEAGNGNDEEDEKIKDEVPQEAEAGAEIENGTEAETGNEVETEKEIEIKEETVTIDVITWESTPEYDSELEGVYIFTPVISDGEYTLAEDVWLPEISVTVADVEMMLEEEELPDVSGSTTPMFGVISSDTTWGAGTLGDGELIIKSGVTLTINGGVSLIGTATIKGGGTILRGSGDAGISVSRNADLTISNITIDGANISSVRSMIWVGSEANLVINDGSVIQNCINQTTGVGEGGAIAASDSGTVILADMSISNCHVPDTIYYGGGAVAVRRYTGRRTNLIIENTIIENCSSAGYAGAIYVASGDAIIKNGTFKNNKSVNGGCITVYDSTLTIEDGNFIGNTADMGGRLYYSL